MAPRQKSNARKNRTSTLETAKPTDKGNKNSGTREDVSQCNNEPQEADVNKMLEITEIDAILSKKNESEVPVPLTMAQKAQIELNRQKALLRRQERMNKRKPVEKEESQSVKQKVIRINDSKLVDTGSGFFIEESPDGITEEDIAAAMEVVTEPAPLLKEDQPFCNDCSQPFDNSYLYHNFEEPVCDGCRDKEDKHSLITKTDARNNYLLSDADFDKRTPILKFIVRKNPHNSRWGDMKLYLKLQIERRALEIWGTEEALEEAIEKREENREAAKKKKYLKKMKELRMNVRSSLYTRATKTHQHEYGDEVYHSDEDEYSKTCTSCGHTYKYDKM